MKDREIEKAIAEKGCDVAPRVTVDHIDNCMEQVFVCFSHPKEAPTTTIATAMLGTNGFVLAVEFSACVSKENFNAEIGKRIAKDKALKAAKDKLWELEGYVLARPALMSQ